MRTAIRAILRSSKQIGFAVEPRKQLCQTFKSIVIFNYLLRYKYSIKRMQFEVCIDSCARYFTSNLALHLGKY